MQRFADAERYYREGMPFCDGRELAASACLRGGRAGRCCGPVGRGRACAGDPDGAASRQSTGSIRSGSSARSEPAEASPAAGELLDEARPWPTAPESRLDRPGAGGEGRTEMARGGSTRLLCRGARAGRAPEPVTVDDRAAAIWLAGSASRSMMSGGRRNCPSRTDRRWSERAGGPPRPRGSGSGGPTTPPWPGSAPRMRPGCGRRSRSWTTWARRPRPLPGGG